MNGTPSRTAQRPNLTSARIRLVLAVYGLTCLSGLSCSDRPELSDASPSPPISDSVVPRKLVKVPPTELSRIQELIQLREGRPPRTSEVLHVLRFHGKEYHVPSIAGRPLIDALLDDRLGAQVFGRCPMMVTRDGVSYLATISETAPSEFHPDQVLATFAQLGVPASQRLRCADSEPTVSDVVRECLARFYLGQAEIEWSAIAFAKYLETPGPFRNRLGEAWSFDDLARQMLDRQFASSSCGGAHRLEAMTILLLADSRRRILSPPVRSRLVKFLSEKVSQAISSQLASGVWQSDWWSGEGVERGTWQFSPQNDLKSQVLITGHLAEWLQTIPDDLADRTALDAVLTRAVTWLRDVLARATSEQVQQSFCPYTHASIAVIRASDSAGLN